MVAGTSRSVTEVLEWAGVDDAGDLAVVIATSVICGSLQRSGRCTMTRITKMISATADMTRRFSQPCKFSR